MATMKNTVQTPSPTWRIGRRVVRGIARTLAVLVGGIGVLAVAGAGYEAIAAAGDAQRYPAPGQLVDVGGYRLHLHCVGTGSPTVVLDAGLSGASLDWSLVQPALGATTRVCAYDRAGMGWSDPGPAPRTPGQIARELHTLLTTAGIPGPYVLVGHSLGGKNVRLFALQHPDAVAGLVLVDTRSEYVDAHISTAEADAFPRNLQAQGGQYALARRLGVARLFGANLLGIPASLPDATRTAMALLTSQPQAIAATTAEGIERATDDGALQAAAGLGDRPLIVLAAEESMTHLAFWPEAQQRLAALSTAGRLIIAQGSRHAIHWDQPALVIDAVQQVVAQARGSATPGDPGVTR
jgi:pimeloyl-ACP methyl ester carboxylesterase